MTKNVVAKAWSSSISDDGWLYTGSPADVTPPSAPILGAATDIDSTGFTVAISTPSVDAQTGVQDYVFYVAPASTGVYVASAPVSAAAALAGYRISGLQEGTSYWVYAKGRDGAANPNLSSSSNIVTATTTAAVVGGWFRNWPIMSTSYLIGSMANNLLDTTQRVYAGEKDLIVIQWWYPVASRTTQRAAAIDWIASNYPDCRMIFYTLANETIKVVSSPGNDARQLTRDLVDGVHGNPNWYARTVSGAQTEASYDPVNEWQMNLATSDAGVNDQGKRFDQAFYEMIRASFNGSTPADVFDDYMAGVYIDNCEARAPVFTTGNGATNVSSSMDFDDDGVVDVLDLYSAANNAGGRMWAEGALNSKATIEALPTPQPLMCIVNGSRWPYDYVDGRNLLPPLPLSAHPFYGKWSITLKEHENQDFGIFGPKQSASAYSYNGIDALTLGYQRLAIAAKMLGPDSESLAGRACILFCANILNRTPQADDYTYSRFFLACCLLVERVAHCVQINSTTPLPLDELFLELGNPVGPRTMGTLNEATLAWAPRSPDLTNGVAKFYWARFANGIAIARLDPPTIGVWPSADAAVSCALPAPGTGKKWQMINAATYVHPTTGLAMRGQNTTINSGADVSAVSLKPYHGVIVRLVDV